MVRLVVAAVAAIATLAVAGCVETRNVAAVSATCTTPSTLHDGFLQNRSVVFRVATQPDPLNEKKTWVCYRIKGPNGVDQGGRIDVEPHTGVSGVEVSSDLSSRACATGPGNLVPPPHPIESGEVAGTPFYLDAHVGLSPATAWLCVEAGGFKQRIKALGPLADEADVVVNSDTAPPAIVDTTPPPAGLASSACAENAYGTPTEHANVHLNGHDLFVYTSRPADNEAHVCARVSGEPSGGGRLSVKAAVNQIVDVRTSSDITPCTEDVVVVSNPALAIRKSPTGSGPPSICVNGTRYTVVVGSAPSVVTFTPDSA
jgi:hypothetical protein